MEILCCQPSKLINLPQDNSWWAGPKVIFLVMPQFALSGCACASALPPGGEFDVFGIVQEEAGATKEDEDKGDGMAVDSDAEGGQYTIQSSCVYCSMLSANCAFRCTSLFLFGRLYIELFIMQ